MLENKLVSVMFMDMQGFTKKSAAQTNEEMKLFHDEMQSFVKQNLERWSGTLVKSLGDGFLARFDSPTQAIQCGLEIQKKLQTRNANVLDPDHLIRFRIGINTGEVGIDEAGDLFGDPVNIAARIQAFSEPNEVFISESTYLAMNRNEFGAQDLGPQNFKNATREIRVYKVMKTSPGITIPAKKPGGAAPTPQSSSEGRPWWKKALAGFFILLLVVVVLKNVAKRVKKQPGGSEIQPKAGEPFPPHPDPRPGNPPAPPPDEGNPPPDDDELIFDDPDEPGPVEHGNGNKPPRFGPKKPFRGRFQKLIPQVNIFSIDVDALPHGIKFFDFIREPLRQMQNARKKGNLKELAEELDKRAKGAPQNSPARHWLALALAQVWWESGRRADSERIFEGMRDAFPPEDPNRRMLEERIEEIKRIK